MTNHCLQGGGQLEPALRLFREMQEEGLTPNTGALPELPCDACCWHRCHARSRSCFCFVCGVCWGGGVPTQGEGGGFRGFSSGSVVLLLQQQQQQLLLLLQLLTLTLMLLLLL